MWDRFSIYPQVYVTYNSENNEPIKIYVNGLFRCLHTFQVNGPKVTIDWNDFTFPLELMVQQSTIQLLYVVSLFNISCNKNIIKE
jgi:hypothetical protein